jgi:DNA polymerase-3 subunit epsilon
VSSNTDGRSDAPGPPASGPAARTLAGIAFTAFDVETTGLFPGVDRIAEIAAVRFDTDRVLGTFQSLVNPGIPMSAEAMAVNGISDGMLVGQPDIGEVLPGFFEFLGSSYPVAHNAMFDVGFISVESARVGLGAPDSPVLDTRGLAAAAFPGRGSYSLDTLRRVHGFSSEGAHRALADAHACRELFLLCAGSIPISRAPDIGAFLRLSGRPLSFSGHKPPEVERIIVLEAAMRRGSALEISYTSAGGETTRRRITPRRFRTVGGSPAVDAFCHLRGEDRAFLVSSIGSIDEVPAP